MYILYGGGIHCINEHARIFLIDVGRVLEGILNNSGKSMNWFEVGLHFKNLSYFAVLLIDTLKHKFLVYFGKPLTKGLYRIICKIGTAVRYQVKFSSTPCSMPFRHV